MNIDSTNMRPSDWMRIRDVIVEGYADHDGSWFCTAPTP